MRDVRDLIESAYHFHWRRVRVWEWMALATSIIGIIVIAAMHQIWRI